MNVSILLFIAICIAFLFILYLVVFARDLEDDFKIEVFKTENDKTQILKVSPRMILIKFICSYNIAW